MLALWAGSALGQTDLQRHLDSLSLKGSITIYDYRNKTWLFSDEQDAETATVPASTFKIPHSLIALEYRAVQDEHEVLRWDGQTRFLESWNKDTDLKTAYKNSTVWFYVALAERLGRKPYQKVLRKIRYGNGDLSWPETDFWNYGPFAITPKNQIAFLIRLYENRLPFSGQTLAKVKQIMVSESTETHTWRDKTGWGKSNGMDIGWWVGYLETTQNVYFFATRLRKPESENNPNFLNMRKEATKAALGKISGLDR